MQKSAAILCCAGKCIHIPHGCQAPFCHNTRKRQTYPYVVLQIHNLKFCKNAKKVFTIIDSHKTKHIIIIICIFLKNKKFDTLSKCNPIILTELGERSHPYSSDSYWVKAKDDDVFRNINIALLVKKIIQA